MNKMYRYLIDHNYISKDENKEPFEQEELSRERAKCIANKCGSLINEYEERISKAIEYIKNIEEDFNCIQESSWFYDNDNNNDYLSFDDIREKAINILKGDNNE